MHPAKEKESIQWVLMHGILNGKLPFVVCVSSVPGVMKWLWHFISDSCLDGSGNRVHVVQIHCRNVTLYCGHSSIKHTQRILHESSRLLFKRGLAVATIYDLILSVLSTCAFLLFAVKAEFTSPTRRRVLKSSCVSLSCIQTDLSHAASRTKSFSSERTNTSLVTQSGRVLCAVVSQKCSAPLKTTLLSCNSPLTLSHLSPSELWSILLSRESGSVPADFGKDGLLRVRTLINEGKQVKNVAQLHS